MKQLNQRIDKKSMSSSSDIELSTDKHHHMGMKRQSPRRASGRAEKQEHGLDKASLLVDSNYIQEKKLEETTLLLDEKLKHLLSFTTDSSDAALTVEDRREDCNDDDNAIQKHEPIPQSNEERQGDEEDLWNQNRQLQQDRDMLQIQCQELETLVYQTKQENDLLNVSTTQAMRSMRSKLLTLKEDKQRYQEMCAALTQQLDSICKLHRSKLELISQLQGQLNKHDNVNQEDNEEESWY